MQQAPVAHLVAAHSSSLVCSRGDPRCAAPEWYWGGLHRPYPASADQHRILRFAVASVPAMLGAWRRRSGWRQKRLPLVASAAAGKTITATPASAEDLRSLRVRELRRTLGAAGLDVAGRVDRESLLELLEPEGAIERVLAATAARVAQAEASARAETGEVPIDVSEACLTIEIALGSSATPVRFMVDTTAPFTMVDNAAAQRLGARLQPGGDPATPRAILGQAAFGQLQCGQLLAVPVQMSFPPGCDGLLALDFLEQFEWDFDFPQKVARVCLAPQGSGTSGFVKTEGLREVRLEKQQAVVSGRSIEVVMIPTAMQKSGGPLVPCPSVLHLASITACEEAVAKDMSLTVDDFIGNGKQLQGAGGFQVTVQEAELALSLGVQGDAVQRNAPVCIGHPILQNFSMSPVPIKAFLGLDVLSQSRVVLFLREGAMWLEA